VVGAVVVVVVHIDWIVSKVENGCEGIVEGKRQFFELLIDFSVCFFLRIVDLGLHVFVDLNIVCLSIFHDIIKEFLGS
jgi:hypothetical protein